MARASLSFGDISGSASGPIWLVAAVIALVALLIASTFEPFRDLLLTLIGGFILLLVVGAVVAAGGLVLFAVLQSRGGRW